MRIGDLAHATGVSTRALRHYEEQGLLLPDRTSAGYRDFSADDVVRVAQITTMIAAGLNTATIRRYLDCVRTDAHGTTFQMCPDLRAELDALAARIDAQQVELAERRRRLDSLVAAD